MVCTVNAGQEIEIRAKLCNFIKRYVIIDQYIYFLNSESKNIILYSTKTKEHILCAMYICIYKFVITVNTDCFMSR